MGINSPNLIRRRVLALFAAPFVARLANAQKKKSPKEGKVTQAEAVIDQYRRGGEFQHKPLASLPVRRSFLLKLRP